MAECQKTCPNSPEVFTFTGHGFGIFWKRVNVLHDVNVFSKISSDVGNI